MYFYYTQFAFQMQIKMEQKNNPFKSNLYVEK